MVIPPRYQSSVPDVILGDWGCASGAHSCRWWGHLHNLGAGWVHWGKRGEEPVNFLFSCLKSLSLGVQEEIVALTFFSGRRVAACQRQLQADHLHFASSLWSERDALPFLLWRLGHRLTQIVLRPLIFLPTPPSSWLYSHSLTSFPDRSSRLIPAALKASWRTKGELFRNSLGWVGASGKGSLWCMRFPPRVLSPSIHP